MLLVAFRWILLDDEIAGRYRMVPGPQSTERKRKSNGHDEDEHGFDVSMYGRLRHVHVNVHGDDDVLQQNGGHDARDDVHAPGLRRHVPDDHGHDDARFVHVQQDVRDVRGNVHVLLLHVHGNG